MRILHYVYQTNDAIISFMCAQIPVIINYDVLVDAYKSKTSQLSRYEADELHSALRNGTWFDEMTLRNVVVMGNNLQSAEFLIDGEYVYAEVPAKSSAAGTTTPSRGNTTEKKTQGSTASMGTASDTPPLSNNDISDPLLPPSSAVTPNTDIGRSATRTSARVAAARADKTARVQTMADKRNRRAALASDNDDEEQGDDKKAGKRIRTKPIVVDDDDEDYNLLDDDEVRLHDGRFHTLGYDCNI